MTSKIDVPRVRTSLEKLGARFGDHRDPRVIAGHNPRYFYHGEPNCLGAHLLLDLGFNVKTIRHLDDDESLRIRAAAINKRFTLPAWELVVWVQEHNDDGRAWGWIAHEAFFPESFTDRVPHPNNWVYRNRPWLEKPTGARLEYAQRYGWGRNT